METPQSGCRFRGIPTAGAALRDDIEAAKAMSGAVAIRPRIGLPILWDRGSGGYAKHFRSPISDWWMLARILHEFRWTRAICGSGTATCSTSSCARARHEVSELRSATSNVVTPRLRPYERVHHGPSGGYCTSARAISGLDLCPNR